jgi:DNA polymerase-3 subunit alpha
MPPFPRSIGHMATDALSELLDRIPTTTGARLRLEDIPPDDLLTFSMLSAGDTAGVFGLQSDRSARLVRRVAPSSLDDLAAIWALDRPAPLRRGIAEEFIAGKVTRTAHHGSMLGAILASTYGVLIYREQVAQIARDIAGFSDSDADALAAAATKGILESSGEGFLAPTRVLGRSDEAGEALLIVAKYAPSSFKRSIALRLALPTYRTAYLKAHFPAEFSAWASASVRP